MKWYTYVVGPLDIYPGFIPMETYMNWLNFSESGKLELKKLEKDLVPSLLEVLRLVNEDEIPEIYISGAVMSSIHQQSEYVFLGVFPEEGTTVLACLSKLPWLEASISLDDIPKF